MDVRCGRCGTEYEFDDALISERGTTVKCTSCGYQFKVYPPQVGQSGPERWIVRTASGRELVYTSLRDLQKGITQRQVGPDDMLSRGNQPPRALGSIAELEPFFKSAGTPVHASKKPNTLHGVAPPANPDARSEVTVNASRPAVAVPPAGATPRPIPQMHAPAPAGAQVVSEEFDAFSRTQRRPPEFEMEPATLPRKDQPPPAPQPPRTPQPPPPPRRPRSEPPAEHNPILTPTPSAIREALKSYDELPIDSHDVVDHLPRRARSRWIAGLVIAGVVALFAVTVGRRYVTRFTATPAQSSERPADARVAAMLEQANRLSEDGDLEGAKEQLDKATVLAERDPAVLGALARLMDIDADLVWLKLRLLDPSDRNMVEATHKLLGRRVGRAREAVDRAAQAAPNDAIVKRAGVDVLRLEGDLTKARSLVGPLSENASQPENAYVLALLDLAEPTPVWSSVIDRLRTAAAGEREVGRARAALVYALVRSGDVEQAKSELGKIEARPRVHPLLAELQSFVHRSAAVADAAPDAKKEVALVDPTTLPALDTRPSRDGTEDREGPGDFRTKLKEASLALKGGDLGRAEQLYNAVLAQQPNNTEALAGLGDIARRRKDPAAAERMYDKVLKENPTYLPALVAKADAKWDAGDRKGAIAIYKRILEQAGPGTEYGQHAQARISQGEGSSSRPEADKERPREAPAPSPAPKEDQPQIDTTDLPGFNKK